MSESQKRQSERVITNFSPRKVIAAIQYPAMSGMAENALKQQTHPEARFRQWKIQGDLQKSCNVRFANRQEPS